MLLRRNLPTLESPQSDLTRLTFFAPSLCPSLLPHPSLFLSSDRETSARQLSQSESQVGLVVVEQREMQPGGLRRRQGGESEYYHGVYVTRTRRRTGNTGRRRGGLTRCRTEVEALDGNQQ